MGGVLRTALVLFVSLSTGSWIGLGRPELRLPHVATAPSAAPAPSQPRRPLGLGPPLPHEQDPSILPTLTPFAPTNPERSIAKAWAVAEGPHRAPGDARRLVTLTFDDGPTPETTPAVLRLLARHRVKATFFVIGRYLDGETPRARAARKNLKRVVAAGHLVGNHTHDHKNLAALSHEEALDQIDRGSRSIERVLGARPILFRPPYGLLDPLGERAIRDRDLELLLWSVEASDMQRDDPDAMFHDLVAQLDYKEGGIVLLHDVRPSSVKVLKRLLEFLRDRPYDASNPDKWGYQIVDLPHYLRAVADRPPVTLGGAG